MHIHTIHDHTYTTNSEVCVMYLYRTYIQIDTIHANRNHIHTEKTGFQKKGFLCFLHVFLCISTYSACIFVYFVCICMYCMYLAVYICIDATINISCRKYKRIHAIQGYYRLIHTKYKIHEKYITNNSV